jgi:gluconokinase
MRQGYIARTFAPAAGREREVIVLLMGVSGSGKTTTGQALAQASGWPFFDGDDLHPEANVAKMAAGQPLTDADRWPWIDRIGEAMERILERGENGVFACSALKKAHRDRLQRAGDVRIVYMKGDFETIAARLAARAHRFMPASLLPSQFAALEEPEGGLVVDIREAVPIQVAHIRDGLAIDASEQS